MKPDDEVLASALRMSQHLPHHGPLVPPSGPLVRIAVQVSGVVQGVGFRPFVHRLATRLQCAGFVRNAGASVHIEIEGEQPRVDSFLADLETLQPPQARLAQVRWSTVPVRREASFSILPSLHAPEAGQAFGIAPDAATCDECIAELDDSGARRHRYPFTSCSRCGPRFTISLGMPFDRERTTMAPFVLCAACAAEYRDPADRRFHAQTMACPACGPQMVLLSAQGVRQAGDDPVADAAAALRSGRIVAIKGLGGYHLACRADHAPAIARLRSGKRRDAKPFALLVSNLAAARELCLVDDAEADRLTSPQRPIVLLVRRAGAAVDAGVAAGIPWLGVMLPYTPVHHLLARDVGVPLVMTSGNQSGDPIVADDAAAIQHLGSIADLFLAHDRVIGTPCEDSVERSAHGLPIILRRSRGRTPEPVILPLSAPEALLALGGHLKSSFALVAGRHASVSQHLGDLDGAAARRAYRHAVGSAEKLFGTTPRLLVHDAHPDYATTRYARERGAADGIATLAIQHHHAHFASCLADNGTFGPAIGVIFDGAGLGADGAIWGGEFLVGDVGASIRAGHLRYTPLPGGERAAREPWRMALAHAREAGIADPAGLMPAIPTASIDAVLTMCARGTSAPWTSSIGRLFDAVAALAGLRSHADHEGQAAMELEGLACAEPDAGAYRFAVDERAGVLEVDPRPLIQALVADRLAGARPGLLSRRFHAGLAAVVAEVCGSLAARSGLSVVALSGGVFQNVLLGDECERRLGATGLTVLRHRAVPPNDGGLCLGQAAAAIAMLARGR